MNWQLRNGLPEAENRTILVKAVKEVLSFSYQIFNILYTTRSHGRSSFRMLIMAAETLGLADAEVLKLIFQVYLLGHLRWVPHFRSFCHSGWISGCETTKSSNSIKIPTKKNMQKTRLPRQVTHHVDAQPEHHRDQHHRDGHNHGQRSEHGGPMDSTLRAAHVPGTVDYRSPKNHGMVGKN